jgi:serine/threonine-protein phosphatase with EF-hand domain
MGCTQSQDATASNKPGAVNKAPQNAPKPTATKAAALGVKPAGAPAAKATPAATASKAAPVANSATGGKTASPAPEATKTTANPVAEKPKSPQAATTTTTTVVNASSNSNAAPALTAEPKINPADGLSASKRGFRSLSAVVLLAKLANLDDDQKRVVCASVIQKGWRRYLALKEVKAELTWQIFYNLDAAEEKELLHLAGFMQILIAKVGAVSEKKEVNFDLDSSIHSTRSQRSDSTSTTGMSSPSSPSVDMSKVKVTPNLLDSLASSTSMKKLDVAKEYDIPKTRKVDAQVVKDIMDVYRAGGKINRDSAVRLMKRCYASMKKLDNTVHLTIGGGSKVTVLGDTHGSINDVIHVLDEVGLPSNENKYVFNGDFVDRGKYGAEVALLLFAVYTYDPANVVLNRGNHEDGPINEVYGFKDECFQKYDESTYDMFVELFTHLPLFTIINKSIFIVHGGLFNNKDVKLEELDKIDRTDYIAQPQVPYPECIEGLEPSLAWAEYFKQLQRDALWSDPHQEEGLIENKRGSGVHFGPDIAQLFMTNNDLSMIIRSHECVRRGFFLPFENTALPSAHNPKKYPLLCTLFSASNYGGSDNEGAYIVVMDHPHTGSFPVAKSGLHYSLSHYKTSTTQMSDIERNNMSSLAELILKKKQPLTMAFEAEDTKQIGKVTKSQWADVMQRVTNMQIRWLGIINTVVSKDCQEGAHVNYRKFLAEYSVSRESSSGEQQDQNDILDSLYSQRKILETIFHYFDTNGDGEISREEFRTGCALINENLPESQQLTDIEHTLDVMDFDGNGVIDLNEFFEVRYVLLVFLSALTIIVLVDIPNVEQ